MLTHLRLTGDTLQFALHSLQLQFVVSGGLRNQITDFS